MENSVNSIRISSLSGTEPSSVVFGCKTATFWPELQISMGPRSHLSFCACKTAWFAPVWQVYMGSSPHLCFFLHVNIDFRTRLTSLYGPQTVSVVLSTHNSVLSTRIKRLYGFQSSPVVLCLQNSVICIRIASLYGSQPLSGFLHAKQRLLQRNHKSL